MSITNFLAGIPVNAALRERIERLLADKERLEKKVEALEKEKADLVREVCHLRDDVAKQRNPADSVEYHGALLLGVSKGPSLVEAHCLACRVPLSTSPIDGRFVCSRCGFVADFNRNGMGHDLSKLPKP